ncbi:MAG: hypothetical protein KKD11_06000 [Candidatus Omnitrophica bacterium]|nr:hypothetical protein [Candidatus Omnitrophota bacterium]
MDNGFTKKELKMVGAALYSCEGTRLRRDKRRVNNVYHWVIEFTNADPKLIKLFLLFMRKVLLIHEQKLKGQLFIYKDLNEGKVEKFWSRVTKIPLSRFNKTIILIPRGYKGKLSDRGTFKLRYHSKETFQKLDNIMRKVFQKV